MRRIDVTRMQPNAPLITTPSAVVQYGEECWEDGYYNNGGDVIKIQARPVVCCGECVHYREGNEHMQEPTKCTGAMAFVNPKPTDFCAWGRKNEEMY